MTKGSTMSKDSEAPPARQISRAKARVAKQAAPKPIPATPSKPSPGSGIAGSVISMNEETRKELETALGTKNISFNTNLFVRTARTAFVFQGGDIHAGAEDALNQTATLVAIKAFKPTDPVEAMIAAQAVMLHNLAMEAGRRAQLPQQSPDVASKLRKDAANGARAMIDMTEALERRRGRGPQTIRVERVVVQDGGQAVVAGSVVTSGTASVTSPPTRQAIPQGASPLATGDAFPVIAGDRGEGE